MSTFDLVIRGGTIVDGTGGEAFEGDVAMADGRIQAVGRVDGRGREEIEAGGRLVTPGFVDIHTHYDGQAMWADRLTPSSAHGVTTVVMGNCGVGFAPCRPGDRDLLVRLMEGVEDIPGVVLTEGLQWSWESFPEFLDALEARDHDIDFATQVPHAALRVNAMGERGANREPARADDMEHMARGAREAVAAGALGFSTSRTLNHRTSDGHPTPTLTAGEDELTAIARALQDLGQGTLQVVSDFKDVEAEFAMLRRIVATSGRPLSVSLVQTDRRPDEWRDILAWMAEATTDGLPIKAQVCGRPIGIVLGLEATLNPFLTHPAYRELAPLPLADRIARMRQPEVREALLTEPPPSKGTGRMLRTWERIFPLGDPPDYEPSREDSIAERARRAGAPPAEVALDALLERDGRALLYLPFLNYAEGSLDPSLEMMRHPNSILGLGDGGAHVGTISDGSFPTTMLSYWTRDRRRGERLSVPFVVRAHCFETAQAVGLADRGLLAPGYKADANVIDYDRLALRAPRIVHDLPAGGRRLIQDAEGYDATVVSGRVIARDGEPTGALPGRLIRGAQAAPRP